ncbi:hypothetical protein [Carboxylicivirga sediminis]|nr:hypothetical protein [Carboxylicivirga sediminis]
MVGACFITGLGLTKPSTGIAPLPLRIEVPKPHRQRMNKRYIN